MRELTAKIIIILFDLLIITFPIYFAEFIGTPHTAPLTNYSEVIFIPFIDDYDLIYSQKKKK